MKTIMMSKTKEMLKRVAMALAMALPGEAVNLMASKEDASGFCGIMARESGRPFSGEVGTRPA